MENLLDDAEGIFLVLRNGEQQYSLWPESAAVPSGWKIVHGPGKRSDMATFIEQNWTDMRPASLWRDRQ